MTAIGFTRLFRAGASHGRNAPSSESQSMKVGFLAFCFSFTSDSGPKPAVARTGKNDPKPLLENA